MPKFIYGSSNIPIEKIPFLIGFTGPTGSTGPTGPTGNAGATAYGNTGGTGPSIQNITYESDKKLNHFYDNGTIVKSFTEIKGLTGYAYLQIEGLSLDSAIPNVLKQDLNTQSYYEAGVTYTIDKVTFRNISTNSDPFVTINYSEDGQSIDVSYSLINVGFLELDGGSEGELVQNILGNTQRGITGSSYNSSTRSIDAQTSNVVQRFLGLTHDNLTNYTKTWWIDHTQGNHFFLYPTYLENQVDGVPQNPRYVIALKKPQNTNNSYSITVIISPGNNSSVPVEYVTSTNKPTFANWLYDDVSPINWPLADIPCLPTTANSYTFINFISIGNSWYGNIIGYGLTNLDSNSIKITNKDPDSINLYHCQQNVQLLSSILNPSFGKNLGITTGVCCTQGCTAEESLNSTCNGYFISGITYLAGQTFCNSLGACCLQDSRNNRVTCQSLKYCDCATIANDSNLSFVWNPFNNTKQTCLDFSCENAFKNLGACCDGRGSCIETTLENCSGYFQGIGTKCSTNSGVLVCYGGTGGCCDSGVTCENNVSGKTCIENNKTYFGDGTNCQTFACSGKTILCLDVVDGQSLKIGDIYDNAIVIGIFNPNQQECLGNSVFSESLDATFNTLTEGHEKESVCQRYVSTYDFSGYGFTADNLCDVNSDSYIVLMSLHPITLNENNEIIEFSNKAKKFEFIWNNGANAWGPLLNPFTRKISELSIDNLQFKEGYVYDYNIEETKNNLNTYSFFDCGFIRKQNDENSWQENRSNISFNGKWTRNFGILNTARMINAEYAYHAGLTGNNFTQTSYVPTESSDNMSCSRALSLFNRTYPVTNKYISDWYIPSYDELAFIATTCTKTSDININSKLLENSGTPMDGWYWSSTGSLNITENEMILNHPSGLTHGSLAWAINFNSDGEETLFTTAKANRTTNEYKVRPIKMIRCDKKYQLDNSSNNKYWRLVKLSEDEIT